ncbi:MAG: MBL fold metallo-hydrolase [gamma proteobacterium symbiont of Bathyaustriella thionipta]|nr:MBL fold metallo-hydrolase [gamma proteobacterium symbiont of Bathyaustriella thionipta]
MRLASLGSGSRGNATLIEAGSTRILIDCGFAARELERRLQQVGVSAKDLSAILVTHEHADHIKGVGALARRYQLPVWMTAGTHAADRCGELPHLNIIKMHGDSYRTGEIDWQPFVVPHDSREPCQFIFRTQDVCLGILTDAGHITPHITHALSDCDALLLECNHDPDMLAEGPYPLHLQRRVGGDWGHLNNRQAVDLLGKLDVSRLKTLIAAHLSEHNNSPQKVRDCLLQAFPDVEPNLHIARQDQPLDWIDLDSE